MYNKQKDLKDLGVLDIFKESFKLIFKCHKIFTKITLAFILPLNLATIFLFTNKNYVPSSFQWSNYWLVYAIFSIAFSLFSISTVVNTVACIYTGIDINVSFKDVVSMASKALKRLMITFVGVYCTIFLYIFSLSMVMMLLWSRVMIFFSIDFDHRLQIFIIIVSTIVITMVAVYMSIIWQLANTISVLETTCGFKAMTKSKELIKGKMGTSLGIYMVLVICSVPSYLLLTQLKVKNEEGNFDYGKRFWLIILTVVWYTFLNLLNIVVQTMIYLVCKSYHGENVENTLALVDHLEVYDAGDPLLNSKVYQMGEHNV